MATGRDALHERLRALFVDKLTESLAVLSRSLLVLERPDRAVDRAEVVNQMVSAAHSLQGGANSAGLPELAEVCHQMEGTLSRLRDESILPTTEVVQALLGMVDVLKQAEKRLRTGSEGRLGDLGRVVSELGTFASDDALAEAAAHTIASVHGHGPTLPADAPSSEETPPAIPIAPTPPVPSWPDKGDGSR